MKHLKKMPFGSVLKRKLPKLPPSQRIPAEKWKFFIGDIVEVVSGRCDVGKRGKVIALHHATNRLTVQGINMAVKHV
ncbi:MAG: hypothetical protein SGCHY_002079, partial [Lobulomycetales sp.]